MRYVEARFEQRQDDLAYRIYVTDSLQNIPQGKYYTGRYADRLIRKPIDNRTADEIAEDIIRAAGLRFEE